MKWPITVRCDIGQIAGIIGFVYILKSLSNERFYIGSTINLETRIKEHNSGKSKYTKLTRPFDLVFSQKFETIQEARKIEYKLKKLKSRKITEKIISEGIIKMGS